MSKPVWRVMPFSAGPCPMVMARRKRSLVSSTRRHVMVAVEQGRESGGAGQDEQRATAQLGRADRQNSGYSRWVAVHPCYPCRPQTSRPCLPGRAAKQRPAPPHPAPPRPAPSPGSMSRRTNLDRSSGVSWLGSVAVMPSLARRRSMTGAKRRPPFWSGGHSRLNRASSDSAWGGGRGRVGGQLSLTPCHEQARVGAGHALACLRRAQAGQSDTRRTHPPSATQPPGQEAHVWPHGTCGCRWRPPAGWWRR